MSNLVKLPLDNTIIISSKIEEYLNPDYLFLPFNNGTLKIKQNDNIFKGQNIFDNSKINVYSPISGKVVGAKKMIDCNNLVMNFVAIENDFKEKNLKRKGTKKNITNYTFEEANNNLKESGIRFNFNVEDLRELDTLIINAIEADPYLMTEYMALSSNVYEILETIDALCEIYNIKRVIMALKENANELVNKVVNHLGMFPKIKIKLVPDLYPIHYEKLLLKQLNIKDKYKILIPSKIIQIYKSLKYKSKPDTKLITINGNAIKRSKIINTKIGTEVKNIISEKIDVVNNDYECLVNGIISGNIIDLDKLIVTDELSSVSLMIKEEKKESECINCGSCVEVCPFSVNPKLVMDTYSSLKKYNTNIKNCTNCGLCTFICPSNINLKKYLRGDNSE